MNLTHKLADLGQELDPAERACLKILLGSAAAGLLRPGSPSTTTATALSTTVGAITRLQPHRDRVPPNGVVYRGRPEFVSDQLLSTLQTESDRLRPSAIRFHDHLVVSGAPGARQLAFSPEMGALVSAHAGAVQPTTKANYLYYDQPGLGIDPHLDNEEFSLNAIMMLQHEYRDTRSALVLYPLDAPPEKIRLTPGELIVMFADSIVHARERVGANERISIAAFGFSPVL